MRKTGIVLCARVGSSRLKNKVLQTINGRTIIEILLAHIVNDVYPVVLAIPKSQSDDSLEQIGRACGVPVYRGYDDCPSRRMLAVAEENGWTDIVRITHDDILIDQFLLRKMITFHENGIMNGKKIDYTYMKKCPEGIAGEIMTVEALSSVISQSTGPIEYLGYMFRTEKYRSREYFPPFEYQYTFRLTIDYPEDLLMMRVLFNSLPEGFGTLDFINFLKQHRYYCNINKLPLLTIYTCCFNQEKYLKRCIESILGQTFTDFEYILIDDGSTDGSIIVANEFYSGLSNEEQKKIKILRRPHNLGLPTNSNFALTQARGRYIMRVDADDMLEPDAVEKMIANIEYTGSQAVISGYHIVDDNDVIVNTIGRCDYHPACCLLYRWAVNELKYKEDLNHFEGLEFFNRFDQLYDISFMPDALWRYRRHDGQKSSSANLKERQKIKIQIGARISHGTATSEVMNEKGID